MMMWKCQQCGTCTQFSTMGLSDVAVRYCERCRMTCVFLPVHFAMHYPMVTTFIALAREGKSLSPNTRYKVFIREVGPGSDGQYNYPPSAIASENRLQIALQVGKTVTAMGWA